MNIIGLFCDLFECIAFSLFVYTLARHYGVESNDTVTFGNTEMYLITFLPIVGIGVEVDNLGHFRGGLRSQSLD